MSIFIMFLLSDTDIKQPSPGLQSSWFAEIPNSEHNHLAKIQPQEFSASLTTTLQIRTEKQQLQAALKNLKRRQW